MSFSFASVLRASVMLSLIALAACDDDTADDSAEGSSSGDTSTAGLKGTVTWAGKTEACDVTHQIFPASQQYSVLCQTAGDAQGFHSVLVQVTFKSEAAARAGGPITVLDGVAFSPEDHPDPKTAESIVIDDSHAYAANDTSTGTMVVTANGAQNVLTIDNQQQFEPGDETTPHPVSATINF